MLLTTINNMNKTALITGASSGIGLDLAKIHAQKGDNLVLIARREDKLLELKTELEKSNNTQVFTITKDLSNFNAAQEVYDILKEKDIRIEYLINNAGFGGYGFFHETGWEKEGKMIDLNIRSLTHFTKLFAKDMVAQGSGKIMNVASTASFLPGPLMAVYYATKHYVLNFSESIANELKGTGVTVTALCPGPTTSGFQDAADLNDSQLFKRTIVASSEKVARYGYKSMMNGKTVAIEGISNKIFSFLSRITPRKIAAAMVRIVQNKKIA